MLEIPLRVQYNGGLLLSFLKDYSGDKILKSIVIPLRILCVLTELKYGCCEEIISISVSVTRNCKVSSL